MSRSIIPLIIFGTGGISREVTFLIEEINHTSEKYEIIGFVESNEGAVGRELMGYSVVASDSSLKEFVREYEEIGAVIPIGTPEIKKNIYINILKDLDNIVYPNIIHPNVTMDEKRMEIGMGNIITSGVRFTTMIKIGNFNLFNLNVTVGHDCNIGDYCVINPLTSISGGVALLGENLVGTGANILENVSIGRKTTIGAGCVVTKDWGGDMIIVGIPGKPINR